MFTYLLNNLNNQLRVASSWLFRVLTLAFGLRLCKYNFIFDLFHSLSSLLLSLSGEIWRKPEKPKRYLPFLYVVLVFFLSLTDVCVWARVCICQVIAILPENRKSEWDRVPYCTTERAREQRYLLGSWLVSFQFLCAGSKRKHINVCCWFCVLIYLFRHEINHIRAHKMYTIIFCCCCCYFLSLLFV